MKWCINVVELRTLMHVFVKWNETPSVGLTHTLLVFSLCFLVAKKNAFIWYCMHDWRWSNTPSKVSICTNNWLDWIEPTFLLPLKYYEIYFCCFSFANILWKKISSAIISLKKTHLHKMSLARQFLNYNVLKSIKMHKDSNLIVLNK